MSLDSQPDRYVERCERLSLSHVEPTARGDSLQCLADLAPNSIANQEPPEEGGRREFVSMLRTDLTSDALALAADYATSAIGDKTAFPSVGHSSHHSNIDASAV